MQSIQTDDYKIRKMIIGSVARIVVAREQQYYPLTFIMLMSLQRTLEIAGFRVETSEDGVKAMEKLIGGLRPDLIITDINMPNMGGIEFIKKARALSGFRFLPILTLTTESQQNKRDEGKQAGATGWLVKPVGSTDLLKIIKQVLPGT